VLLSAVSWHFDEVILIIGEKGQKKIKKPQNQQTAPSFSVVELWCIGAGRGSYLCSACFKNSVLRVFDIHNPLLNCLL
jgi:hypothetical protein